MVVLRSASDSLVPGAELADAIGVLGRAGHKVWAVGGTVRDALLGREHADWDLATDASPEVVARAIPSPVHQEPVLGAVASRLDGLDTVWTTLRAEADYGIDRRPRVVRFVTDPVIDAQRRDFTVNAVYCEMPERAILDPVGGIDDLRDSRLRAIGDPRGRLREDPLRVLRGIRFAAALGLVLEPQTRLGLRAAAADCANLSAERVHAEVGRALCGPGRGRAAALLAQLGVVDHALPEVSGRPAVEWRRIAALLEALPPGLPAASWAAFAGSRTPASRLLRRLGAPRRERRGSEALLDLLDVATRWPAASRAERDAALRHTRVPGAIDFLRACEQVLELPASRIETIVEELHAHESAREVRMVDGKDVVAAGLPPGPGVGEILRAVESAVRRGSVRERDEAMDLVRRLVGERVKVDGPGGR